MYITQALDEGDGYAHLKRWRRGTYIFINMGHINIKVLGKPFSKVFNVTLTYLQEAEWLPGKGMELCNNCKWSERLIERAMEESDMTCMALAKHLKLDHCKCEGDR